MAAKWRNQTRLVLDETIINASYGAMLISALNEEKVYYNVQKLPAPYCMLWEQKSWQGENTVDAEWIKECHIFRLMTTQELLISKEYSTLSKLCKEISAALPEKRLTFIIIKAKTFQLESSYIKVLSQLQICAGVQWRQYSLIDLIAELKRINKAVFEKICKKQRSETQQAFKNYLVNNKRCVRVVGSNGLMQLWKQSLNVFQGVTLQVSEAVIAKYPCPKSFLEMCKNKTLPELLLQSKSGPSDNENVIKAGILNKLYKYYYSVNPSEVL